MTLLKTTVVVIVAVNVVHVNDVVLNVVMIIMYLVLVNKRSSEAPKRYICCLVVGRGGSQGHFTVTNIITIIFLEQNFYY